MGPERPAKALFNFPCDWRKTPVEPDHQQRFRFTSGSGNISQFAFVQGQWFFNKDAFPMFKASTASRAV
jgi:hypothetical protein